MKPNVMNEVFYQQSGDLNSKGQKKQGRNSSITQSQKFSGNHTKTLKIPLQRNKFSASSGANKFANTAKNYDDDEDENDEEEEEDNNFHVLQKNTAANMRDNKLKQRTEVLMKIIVVGDPGVCQLEFIKKSIIIIINRHKKMHDRWEKRL